MFRELTRKKQALLREECLELLRREKRGVLSVQGDGGYPYGMPLDHWYCEEDGCLYFHSGKSGHKLDALKNFSFQDDQYDLVYGEMLNYYEK